MVQRISLPTLLALASLVGLSQSLEPVFKLPHRGCYFTSWSRYRPVPGQFLPNNVDPSLCTIILYAFGQIQNNGLAPYDSNDPDNIGSLVAFKSQHPDLKVLLSVGGYTLSNQFPPMASSPANRAIFVQSCVKMLRQWGLDGIDIDWEYPTMQDKPYFTLLLQELRTAFAKESQQSGKARLIISAAVSSVQTTGYDVPAISMSLDLINVMTYDFHGASWEPTVTGHNSPLYPSSADPQHLSISGAMQAWQNLGADKAKLNVGLAAYGITWTLADPNQHVPGSAATGPGPAGPITGTAGILAYSEICQMLKSGELIYQMDEKSKVPYAYSDSMWVSYDNPTSFLTKTQFAMKKGYAGVFVWEMGYDDFHGMCGKINPLLHTISQEKQTDNCPEKSCKPMKNGLFAGVKAKLNQRQGYPLSS